MTSLSLSKELLRRLSCSSVLLWLRKIQRSYLVFLKSKKQKTKNKPTTTTTKRQLKTKPLHCTVGCMHKFLSTSLSFEPLAELTVRHTLWHITTKPPNSPKRNTVPFQTDGQQQHLDHFPTCICLTSLQAVSALEVQW